MTGDGGRQNLPVILVRCTPEGATLAGRRIGPIKVDVEGGKWAVPTGLAATVAR